MGSAPVRRAVFGVFIAGLLLACGVVATAGTEAYRRDDFWCLRTAGQLVLERRNPYDERIWASTAGAPIPLPGGGSAPSACTGTALAYPLWTAIAMVPFALVPPVVAATAWIAISVAAIAWATAWCWRAFAGPARAAPLCAVVVAFSQPLWFDLRYGQTAAIELGLLGLTVWALCRGRERPAGVTFAGLALKPQLVLLAVPTVLAEAIRRDRRPFLVAAGGTFLAFAAGSLIAAPAWPFDWLSAVLGPRLRVAALLPTVWGLANDTLGSPAWGVALVVGLGLGIVLLVRGVPVDRVSLLALGVSVSLFASPHVWSYDHLLLVIPWSATLAIAASAGHRALLFGAVAAASLVPWVAYAVSTVRVSETYAAAVPACAGLLLAYALRLRGPTAAGAV